MRGQIDTLLRAHLDTLPVSKLRHLVSRWCDATPVKPDAAEGVTKAGDALSTISGGDLSAAADAAGDVVSAGERIGAYTRDGLQMIVERWHRARDPFRDVDAGTMFGAENSLSYGAHRDTVVAVKDTVADQDILSAVDTLTSTADTMTSAVTDTLSASADTVTAVTDSLSVVGADSLSAVGADSLLGGGSDSLLVAGVDSLSVGGVDSLSVAADSLAISGDTLATAVQGFSAGGSDTTSSDVLSAVKDVVGDAVVDAVGGMSVYGDATGLAAVLGNVEQNLLVFAVVFLYVFGIYRYFDEVKALFESVFRYSLTPSDRIIEHRRSEIFYGFLGKLFLIGTLSLGTIVLLWAGGMPVVGSVHPYARLALPFAAMAIFAAVVVAQYTMLAVAGGVTRSWPTVALLMRIRLIYFVLATVIVMPSLLMSQLNEGLAADIWLSVAGVAAFATVALYVRESVTLFISKKISILHWFLYLCTVEVLPFTLLWRIVEMMGK